MTTPTITLSQVKAFARDPAARQARMALAAARAELARISAEVDPQLDALFASMTFPVCERFRDRRDSPVVTKRDHLYLADLEGPEVKAFSEQSHALYLRLGYHVEPGYCPVLMARHAVTQAEWKLLEIGQRHFGVDFTDTYGDLREKSLALLMEQPGEARS